MKRTVIGYLFTLTVILFSFSAVYSIQFRRLKQELMEQGYIGDGRQTTGEVTDDNTSEETEPTANGMSAESTATIGNETESSAEEVDAKDDIRTNSSMLFVVGQYDWDTGTVTETVEKFPEELLDMTRQELLVFLKDHSEYGSLLSFSEYSVYLRKNEHADWSEYLYFLTVRDGEVKVYRLEDDRLYLSTGISEDELREETHKLLSDGLYIKDKAALFDFLQTVTS